MFEIFCQENKLSFPKKSKDAIGSGCSIMNVSLKTKVHDSVVKYLSNRMDAERELYRHLLRVNDICKDMRMRKIKTYSWKST